MRNFLAIAVMLALSSRSSLGQGNVHIPMQSLMPAMPPDVNRVFSDINSRLHVNGQVDTIDVTSSSDHETFAGIANGGIAEIGPNTYHDRMYLNQAATGAASTNMPYGHSGYVGEAQASLSHGILLQDDTTSPIAGDVRITTNNWSDSNPTYCLPADLGYPGYGLEDVVFRVNFFVGHNGGRSGSNLDLAGGETITASLGPWSVTANLRGTNKIETPEWDFVITTPIRTLAGTRTGALNHWEHFPLRSQDLGFGQCVDPQATATFDISFYSEPHPSVGSSANILAGSVAAVWVTATLFIDDDPPVGDLDGDGAVGLSDINLLIANARGSIFPALGSPAMPPSPRFDLNQDLSVDFGPGAGDSDQLICTSLGTEYGDANLDGIVNVSDFNIWNSHKFTYVDSWDKGDFNGDGVVDVSDFNILQPAMNGMGHCQSLPAVPEPSGALLLLLGTYCLAPRRRRSLP